MHLRRAVLPQAQHAVHPRVALAKFFENCVSKTQNTSVYIQPYHVITLNTCSLCFQWIALDCEEHFFVFHKFKTEFIDVALINSSKYFKRLFIRHKKPVRSIVVFSD